MVLDPMIDISENESYTEISITRGSLGSQSFLELLVVSSFNSKYRTVHSAQVMVGIGVTDAQVNEISLYCTM